MGGLLDVSTAPRVQAAIERLYAVFARYPLRPRLAGCPHCFSEADDRALHTRPLREMPEERLTMFAWKAMTTWGDERDFKHFFPRLCELVVSSDDLLHFGMWFFKRKLMMTSYPTWPYDERAAFGAFLMAWWRALLAAGGDGDQLDWRLLTGATDDDAVSLEAVAPFVDDPRLFLDALLDELTADARLLALATYRRLYWLGEVPSISLTAAQRGQVSSWLLDERTLSTMRRLATEVAQAPRGGEQDEELFPYEEWPSTPSRLAADVLELLG